MQSADLKLIEKMKPVPPPDLSKENQGVWYGWCCKGDREVAREAAAKGLHIDLVIKFILLRKKISPDDARQWFNKEVFLWVDELLSRKQIFRACHILKNIKLDPDVELSNIFYSTNNKELRDYIGQHLEKNKQLTNRLSTLWHLLELILRNNLLMLKYKLAEESLKCLDGQEDQWKHDIAAKLFLRAYDLQLIPYLNAECLWKQLLAYNDIKLLNTWINVRFNSKETYEISDKLLQVFKIFPISNDMLNELSNKDTSSSTHIIILNEFSKFGVFSDFDRNNLLNILTRLSKCNNITNIYDILSKNTSNLSIPSFLALLHDYCVNNKFYLVFTTCMESFDVSLLSQIESPVFPGMIKEFRVLKSTNFRQDLLCDNIFNVSKFLSKDLISYFSDDYSIFLALVILSKDINFLNSLLNKSVLFKGEELYEVLKIVLQKLKTVDVLYNKYFNVPVNTLTYYHLLENHVKVDLKALHYYDGDVTEIPHFSYSQMVENYGYAKEVNYLFYLRQSMPTIASACFKISEVNLDKSIVFKKVLRIAVLNFDNPEITTGCIAFLEFIDARMDLLRVIIHSANILAEKHDRDFIVKLFLDVTLDPCKVLNLLELEIIALFEFKNFNDEKIFVDCFKKYHIVCKFCSVFNLKPPELFLKHCASQNMWLPFLIFAQLNHYSIEQVKLHLQSLKNPNLLEHIIHSVIHDIQVEDNNVLMKDRDSRKYFLSRIGVRKNVEVLGLTDSLYSGTTSQSSIGSGASSTGSDFLEIDILNTKATLLQTLIRCHNSTDPPRALLQASQLYRNPLLAVLATSYEPDSIITNWLTWLAVSTELYETFTNFDTVALCSQSVGSLLNDAMARGYPKTLIQSFEIFIPDCPLKQLLKFFNLCINMHIDDANTELKLHSFLQALNRSRRNSILTETDHEMTYLNNKTWLETTALQLLSSMLQYNCKSLYQQICVSKLLTQLKFSDGLSTEIPGFHKVYEILNLLFKSNAKVKVDIGKMLDIKESRKAIIDCINDLLSYNQFDVAMEVANIENLPLDFIIIKEWKYRFENRQKDDHLFWETCDADLTGHNVTADCVIDFYSTCFNKIISELEKYKLLKYSWKWANLYNLSTQYDIEKRMWVAFASLEDKWKNYDDLEDKSSPVLYKEMLDKLSNVPEYDEIISKECLRELEKLLGQSLNRNNFWLALRLEKMFDCKSTDLEILKLCFSLAEGTLLPYQLNTQQRLLLTKGTNFRRLSHRRTFISRFSSFSSASPSTTNISFTALNEGVEAPLQDTLATLQSLSEKLTNGSEIAFKIFTSYRISINIEIPYQVFVLNTDYMKILKDALEDDCLNKLEVVHDFILLFQWSKEQIADFICEEIVQSASVYVKSKTDQFTIWDLNANEDYHLILQLQDSCSLLGYKIYSYANALHSIQITTAIESKIKISELALVIELLVMAHNCFTADCNMEGISTILKKCQAVVSNLLTLRSWKLIVRLLTGVARYTEMSYAFQILRENDQFEFLLRKGSRKDNALKVALLDYLKKYCPDNRELYKIVALHFTLFSEVAQLWEREAKSVIKNLIEISKMEMQNNKVNPESQPFVLLSNTESTKICLNKAMEDYTHATEFHLQGEKLAKAMNSAKQVELLALQISILNEVPTNSTTYCILNLISNQLTTLINNHMSFEQSYILIQAYNFQPDWTSTLYEHCIIKNNLNYLNSFLNHLPLTETLVHDISRKFLNANINSNVELKCMKFILSKIPSVHTKYRIASELGFTDLVEELLLGGQLAYLKDTVWKKGYKS